MADNNGKIVTFVSPKPIAKPEGGYFNRGEVYEANGRKALIIPDFVAMYERPKSLADAIVGDPSVDVSIFRRSAGVVLIVPYTEDGDWIGDITGSFHDCILAFSILHNQPRCAPVESLHGEEGPGRSMELVLEYVSRGTVRGEPVHVTRPERPFPSSGISLSP